jgi:hypothetical protein
MDYLEKCQGRLNADDSVVGGESLEARVKELEESLREKDKQIKNLIGINRSKGNVIDDLKKSFYDLNDSSRDSLDFHSSDRGQGSQRNSNSIEKDKNCLIF